MQYKAFFQSKTIAGVLVTILGFFASHFNVNLADVLPQVGPALIGFIGAILQLAGLIQVIVGRFVARGPLTATKAIAVAKNSIQSVATVLVALLVVGAALMLAGCASTGTLTPGAQTVLADAESAAWTAANAIETVNTATGGVLTTAAVDYALTATHNTGDTAVVQAAAVELNKVIAAQAAAKVNGASPAGMQAAATATLSDPGVISATAAMIATPVAN